MGLRTHDFIKFNDDRAALEFNSQSAAFTITVDGTVVYDSSAGTSAAELEYLDIATLGTGAASKAVVLDASGDYTYPAAATIVYPSGASLTLESGSTFDVAGTFEIANVAMTAGAAELNLIDGSLAGTVVVSKAAIYDSNGKLNLSSATVAALGTTIADAVAMTKQFNAVTGATGGASGGTGVLLPVAMADEVVVVVNTDATNALKVYAVTGSQVNALGSTVAYLVTPGQMAIFVGRSATLWYTAAATDTITGLTASATELNYNDIATLGTGAASKAVVLDAGDDYTWPATGILTYGVLKDPAATTITATGAEINKLDDSAVVMTKGSGVATGETYASGVFLNGTLKVTRIMVDLTTLVSGAADLDIIGDTGGAANAHFGQITAALNGTIVGGQVTCLEAPAGGATDIDFYSATVGTGAQDADVTALTETVLITAGGAWTSGAVKGMTTVPPANDYLYIVNGAASAGAFSAGKFLIELFGV